GGGPRPHHRREPRGRLPGDDAGRPVRRAGRRVRGGREHDVHPGSAGAAAAGDGAAGARRGPAHRAPARPGPLAHPLARVHDTPVPTRQTPSVPRVVRTLPVQWSVWSVWRATVWIATVAVSPLRPV